MIPTLSLSEGDPRALACVCEQVGMFFVRDHAVPPALLSEAVAVTRAFFDLPAADKRRARLCEGRGFVPLAGCEAPRERKETFNLMEPMPPESWPSLPAEFQVTMRAYFAAMEQLAVRLLRCFARALGWPEDHLDGLVGEHASVLRLVDYLVPVPGVALAPYRCEPHSDYGTVSILQIADAPGGLQLREPTGTWRDVPVAPGALLVNLGDAMQGFTAGRWISPVHRVVNPPPERHADARRQTLVFFHNPGQIREKVARYLAGE